MRIVLEHITSAEAVDDPRHAEGPIAATITAHRLMINRNAMFASGIRPHICCPPVAKRELSDPRNHGAVTLAIVRRHRVRADAV